MLSWIITTMLSVALTGWMTLFGCATTESPRVQEAPPATQVSAIPEEQEEADAAAVAPAVAEVDAPQLPPNLVELLDRLEASAVDLTGFAAKIDYETYDDFLGSSEVRTGELSSRSTRVPLPASQPLSPCAGRASSPR